MTFIFKASQFFWNLKSGFMLSLNIYIQKVILSVHHFVYNQPLSEVVLKRSSVVSNVVFFFCHKFIRILWIFDALEPFSIYISIDGSSDLILIVEIHFLFYIYLQFRSI